VPTYGDCHSTEITASPQACFDAPTDYQRLPERQGAVNEAQSLERDRQDHGSIVDYESTRALRPYASRNS
jgi:hypothetical protein